jgi:hypothetical protein
MLAGAAAPVRVAAQTIDTIVVENHNIFDAGDNDVGFLARLANALHIRTRPSVIRRTLFLNQGDGYDSARILESERALRDLLVFRNVALDTTRVDGRFALRVTTADGWSTRPAVGFSSAAGDVTWDVGVVERNLLGTAQSLMLDYRKTPDRRLLTLVYQIPALLFRRAILSAAYVDLSDGGLGWWYYGVPFYETSAPGSLVTAGEAGTVRVLRFRDGFLADSLRRRSLRFAVDGGIALQATNQDYTRLRFSARWRREDFTAYGAPVARDSQTFTAGVGVAMGRSRFRVLEGFDTYARREDVDVSERLWLGLWAAPRAFGYTADRAGVGTEIAAQTGAAWRDGFAWLRMNADAVIGASGIDSGRVEAGATMMSQRFARQTVVLHAEGGAANRIAPGTEFDLWLWQNGPRAFGAHAFTGTRRYWLVAEDRILVASNFLGLLGLGIAPFVEWGGAWYSDERPRAGGDAGLALRLGATRSVRGEVTEIAFANRFGAGSAGHGWALVVRQAVDFR